MDYQVSSIVLPNLVKTALNHGVDIQSIFQRLDVKIDLARIDQTTIRVSVLGQILELMAEKPENIAIALHIGKEFAFEYLPHVKMYVTTVSTVREAAEIVEYIKVLITPMIDVCLKEENEYAVFELNEMENTQIINERFIAEAVFAAIIWLDELSPDMSLLKEVHFKHNEIKCLKYYEKMFKVPVVLSAKRNAVLFDIAYLDTPLLGASPETKLHAKNLIEQHVTRISSQNGMSKVVSRMLESKKELLGASLEQVSDSLGLSPRTLQRRLMSEGTNFSKLQNHLKSCMAVKMLESGKESIEDISEYMGYSDRRSFTRAFKSWTGQSPSQYRKKR